ncbi:MAG TPA: hypothetical protein VI603_15515 [Saprospiraceae bacterium]|nr:hypothetical protein [Saprospiraceae bacterium]
MEKKAKAEAKAEEELVVRASGLKRKIKGRIAERRMAERKTTMMALQNYFRSSKKKTE